MRAITKWQLYKNNIQLKLYWFASNVIEYGRQWYGGNYHP